MFNKNAKIVGDYLKDRRESKNQTLAEVSGAAELEIDQLILIEAGLKLPEEEVLVTLISFLQIPDDDAKDIFTKAGYFDEQTQTTISATPVLYCDELEVQKSKDGVVIDFKQPNHEGGSNSFRFGLSESITYELIKQLMKQINKTEEIRLLPDVRKRTNTNK
ncbi:MAG: hypothetical protein M3P98_04580 [bacterium]|nr:hypothetical protein [bacterium]